jgi:hypothetical protein
VGVDKQITISSNLRQNITKNLHPAILSNFWKQHEDSSHISGSKGKTWS